MPQNPHTVHSHSALKRNGFDFAPGFGFQGQETYACPDLNLFRIGNEVAGKGNSVFFKYRIHDPRLGRFLSVDPLAPEYPHNSPYAFSENRVVDAIELEGLEVFLNSDGGLIGQAGNNPELKVVGEFEAFNNTASSLNTINGVPILSLPKEQQDKVLKGMFTDVNPDKSKRPTTVEHQSNLRNKLRDPLLGQTELTQDGIEVRLDLEIDAHQVTGKGGTGAVHAFNVMSTMRHEDGHVQDGGGVTTAYRHFMIEFNLKSTSIFKLTNEIYKKHHKDLLNRYINEHISEIASIKSQLAQIQKNPKVDKSISKEFRKTIYLMESQTEEMKELYKNEYGEEDSKEQK